MCCRTRLVRCLAGQRQVSGGVTMGVGMCVRDSSETASDAIMP